MDIYRVVCSENDRLYPGQTFVDFMPAGTNRCENAVIHDTILKIRQMANPEVDALTSGLLLYDLGDGRIQLHFERANNFQIRRFQDHVKAKYSNMIIERFKEMRAAGKDRTLDFNLSTLAVAYDFYRAQEDDTSPQSARERALREEARKYREAQTRRKELNEYYRTHKAGGVTELAWKMARYHGD